MSVVADQTVRVNFSNYWDDTWTDTEIAQKLNMNRNTVRSYRLGQITTPKLTVLIKFRNFFQQYHQKYINLEELIDVTGD